MLIGVGSDAHHPLEHKLSVVRTLLSRKDEIVTEEGDRLEEEHHVKQVLRTCKYPDWAIQRVEKQLTEKKEGAVKPKPDRTQEKESRGMVVLPYVKGVTERVQRTMRKHGIQTPARPHRTLRQMLVHPKDKLQDSQKCGTVYCVPCLSCPQKYIGESGRKLGTRIGEHRRETDKTSARTKTRSTSVTEDTSTFKSAISEHARDLNHIMDWNNIKVIDREDNKYRRWIKEAIQVRKLEAGVPMNRDEGGYELAHVWDPLLRPAPTTPGRSRQQYS